MSESQDNNEQEIIYQDSSLPSRLGTYSIRNAFEEAEEDDPNKTNLQFLHNDTCFCMSPYNQPDDIAILIGPTGQECGHSMHKECCHEYLTQTQMLQCPTCRSPIDKISTTEWGQCTIEEFENRYETELQLCAMPTFGLSRQVTCGGYSGIQCTQAYSYSQDDDDNMRYKKNGVALSAIPILESQEAIKQSNCNNATSLFSGPSQFILKENLGTFAFIAPYQESADLSGLNADIYLILDVSGSMAGERINKCKDAIKIMIAGINGKSRIRVSLITFDDYAVQEFPLGIISLANYDNIIKIVDSLCDSGGTNYNVAFELLSKILSDRDSIVFFFSDGEPSITTDLSILQGIYGAHPQLTMYVISIGADVNADKALIPLLCDRHHDVAVYRHFSELDEFPQFIANVVGETTTIYATDIKITFSAGIRPISSKCETTEDGISSICVPFVRFNDMIQFAFTQSETEQPIIIRTEYTIDGQTYMIVSVRDNENLLGEILSKHFAIKRFLDRECNIIRYRTELTNRAKQDMLRNILNSITMEHLGTFYDEFKYGLEHMIESFELISSRKRNIENILSQIDNNLGSVNRQVSASIARGVSSRQRIIEDFIEEDS